MLAQGEGRSGFETRQGLTIVGALPIGAVVQGERQADLFDENGAKHIRGHRVGEPQTAAVELDNGNWVATCILPDFIGTVVVNEGLVATVNYAPAHNTHRFSEPGSRQLAPVVNRWTALMHQGRFGDYQELETTARELRQHKHANPSLGILAAYAYERAGNLAEIDDIAWWFVEMDQPIPFDVALLSTKPVKRAGADATIEAKDGRTGRIAGSFPLLTQGWSFLDPEDDSMHPALLALRPGLLPAL